MPQSMRQVHSMRQSLPAATSCVHLSPSTQCINNPGFLALRQSSHACVATRPLAPGGCSYTTGAAWVLEPSRTHRVSHISFSERGHAACPSTSSSGSGHESSTSAAPHAHAAHMQPPQAVAAPSSASPRPADQQHMYQLDADDEQSPGAPKTAGTVQRTRPHYHMPPRHRPDADASEESRRMDAANSATAWASFDGEAHKAFKDRHPNPFSSYDPSIQRGDAYFSFDGTPDAAVLHGFDAFDQFDQQPAGLPGHIAGEGMDADDRPYLQNRPVRNNHKAARIAALAAELAAANDAAAIDAGMSDAGTSDAGSDVDNNVGGVTGASGPLPRPAAGLKRGGVPHPHHHTSRFSERLQAAINAVDGDGGSISSGSSEDLHV